MVRTVCLKNFDFASQTDKGKVRAKNEDFIAYFDTFNGHVFVLCDGMGGHNAGDVASELAAESVRDFFNNDYHSNPFEAIEGAITHANEMVYSHSIKNNHQNGMGTTIVLILIRDDRVYYGHAGDSRLYLFKNNVLDQMTLDHSHVQQLISKGRISKKEAQKHPRRNQITKAIGLSRHFEPEISPKAIIPEDDDILLLCSDGLTSLVTDKEIQSVLESYHDLNGKAAKLINKANKKGGDDNISVQIIKFHNINIHEEDYEVETTVFTQIRELLRKKKLVYILIMLFILGSSFYLGMYEGPQLSINKRLNRTKETTSIIIAYKIKENDNIKWLTEKFNLEEGIIEKMNANIDSLEIGTHLKIPVKSTYTVMHTDELPVIANKFGVDKIDILKANDLGQLNLKIGSELYIPLNNTKEELE